MPVPRRSQPRPLTQPLSRRSWEQAAAGFPEIPKGRNPIKIWYNPAVRCRLRTRISGSSSETRPPCAQPVRLSTGAPCPPLLQIIPLYAVITLAAGVCGGYLFKYFTGNTEVNWSKTLRGTHDNQGINEKRVASHNSRFGFRSLNKHMVTIFPFSYIPFDKIGETRRNPAYDHTPAE